MTGRKRVIKHIKSLLLTNSVCHTPHLVTKQFRIKSAKLSYAEHSRYLDGRPLGNTGAVGFDDGYVQWKKARNEKSESRF